MKPVIIIAVAVVILVVVVFGFNQEQVDFEDKQEEVLRLEAIEKRVENRDLCVKLLGNKMSIASERNPYLDCLDYGIDFAIQSMLDECYMYGSDLSVERSVCLLEKLKILKEKIGYSP